MEQFKEEILTILATGILNQLGKCDKLRITQLNAFVSFLIKAGSPFDLEFSPGTRRIASSAQITIYINSTTTISRKIAFEAGGTAFGKGV